MYIFTEHSQASAYARVAKSFQALVPQNISSTTTNILNVREIESTNYDIVF